MPPFSDVAQYQSKRSSRVVLRPSRCLGDQTPAPLATTVIGRAQTVIFLTRGVGPSSKRRPLKSCIAERCIRVANRANLMAIGGEKNDQPGRYQPDEEIKPRHHEIERGHTTLLSGEAGSLPGTVSYLRSLA